MKVFLFMALSMDERVVIVSCGNCGKLNRVPFAAHEAKCGGCGTMLSAPAEPIEVPTAAAFEALVGAAGLPVVVDFWAPWCGPCRMVAPELQKVAASNAGRYLVVKVNTDAMPELGDRFRIRAIPTKAVLEGGKEVARNTGVQPAAQIATFVRQSVSAVSKQG